MVLISSSLLLQTLGIALLTLATLLILSPTTLLTSATLSILGSSMHIRPASYIPDAAIPSHLLPESQSTHANNPFYVPLVRPKKTLALSERELLALFGLSLGFLAVGMNVLGIHLRYSAKGLTSWTNAEGRVERKPSLKLEGDVKVVTAAQELWQVVCAFNVIGSAGFVAWIYLRGKAEWSGVFGGADHNSGAGSSSGARGQGWDVLANNVVFTFMLCNMLFWGYLFTVIKEERREVILVLQKRREEDEEDAVNEVK